MKIDTFYKPERIYFILSLSHGLTKIGTSRDVQRRIRQIRNGGPVPLNAVLLGWIEDGGETLETLLHERFRDARRHGEWFLAREVTHAAVEAVLAKFLAKLNDEGWDFKWRLVATNPDHWSAVSNSITVVPIAGGVR